jgi:hypothetical protein
MRRHCSTRLEARFVAQIKSTLLAFDAVPDMSGCGCELDLWMQHQLV